MRDELTAVVLSQKAGAITASSSVFTWLASVFGWLDIYLVKITAIASFILLLTMIVANICSTMRQNRESKIKAVRDELEIEILRRKLKDE
jgi:preprotein translocase subunit SecG